MCFYGFEFRLKTKAAVVLTAAFVIFIYSFNNYSKSVALFESIR